MQIKIKRNKKGKEKKKTVFTIILIRLGLVIYSIAHSATRSENTEYNTIFQILSFDRISFKRLLNIRIRYFCPEYILFLFKNKKFFPLYSVFAESEIFCSCISS